MKILLYAVVLILFCVGNGLAESPRHVKSPESISSNHPTKKTQYGTDDFPFVVKTINSPKNQEEAERDADERNDRKALNKFTLWLTIIGGFQIVILAFQIYFLGKTLRATKQAADAAEKSANHITKIERAYVFVSATMGDKKLLSGKFILHDTAFDNVYLSMSVVLKNHGKTPAILSRVYGGWVVDNSPPTKASIRPMSKDKIPPGIILSADGEPYPLKVGDPIQKSIPHVTIEKWQQIERGETALFLYGRIEYKDVLGDDRNTGFCWQYCPGDETTGFSIAGSDLNYCDENNDGA